MLPDIGTKFYIIHNSEIKAGEVIGTRAETFADKQEYVLYGQVEEMTMTISLHTGEWRIDYTPACNSGMENIKVYFSLDTMRDELFNKFTK
jgi:hypothetical protein